MNLRWSILKKKNAKRNFILCLQDIGDTTEIRNSLCGLELLEEGSDGIYVGPKDGEDETDIFVKVDDTHMKIINGDRCLELSRQTAYFLKSKEKDIKSGIVNGESFVYTRQLDPTSIFRITTNEVPREMLDCRIWYKNCVGRFAPTKCGARLHYIHMVNIFTIIDEFLA